MKKRNNNITSRLEVLDKDKIFDMLVIGGGISGACILWDGVLRELSCILVEKNDYASGTSQATSKLIHGGLRYLKNGEISLVKESLDERKILAKLTPHSIRPLGFLIPIYDLKNLLLLRAGLTIYDYLSLNKNVDLLSDSLVPNHEYLSKEQTISEDPNIPRSDLKGSVLYYDYANINPERHTCDFIFSARRRGARVFNYTEVKKIEFINNIYHILIYDRLTGVEFLIKSRTIVNSSGPWADNVDKIILNNDGANIIRSKGIHIVTRNISQKHCSIRITKSKKHLFVIPWRNRTIIGTTDTIYEGNPDNFSVSRNDILNLIEEINDYLNFKVQERDVYFYYGGMRPLVEDGNNKESNTYNVSRKTEITEHKDSGKPGFITALGGKYTTSRGLAEKVVDKVCGILGKGKECSTKVTRLISGNFSDVPSLVRDLKTRYYRLSEEKAYNLAMRYGSQVYELAELNKELFLDTQSGIRIQNEEEYYKEEIEYICRFEDVFNLSDFYFRRSGIGNIGKPKDDTISKINSIVSETLGKSVSKSELADFNLRFIF